MNSTTELRCIPCPRVDMRIDAPKASCGIYPFSTLWLELCFLDRIIGLPGDYFRPLRRYLCFLYILWGCLTCCRRCLPPELLSDALAFLPFLLLPPFDPLLFQSSSSLLSPESSSSSSSIASSDSSVESSTFCEVKCKSLIDQLNSLRPTKPINMSPTYGNGVIRSPFPVAVR